jgi:hypothetical protein
MIQRNVFSILLAAPLALAACDSDAPAEGAEAGAQQEEQIPNVQVNLPPSPNFDEDKAPEKWDDGSTSIFGLRQNVDENLAAGNSGTIVQVKGWVQEVYVPPECPEGQFCPPGKQPHVWITDHEGQQGKKRAMMVVNYRFQVPEWDADRWKGAPEVVLEVGKQYTFKGKFVRFSSTGFAHDQGLLEFDSYQAINPATGQMDWIYPPGAAWHPMEVARQEEENARLAERAAQTAADYKTRQGGE